jgi:uncharacterized protein (DUF302 family)
MTEPAGLIEAVSPLDAKTTLDRLQAALTAAGVAVFGRIDHAAGASGAGLDLRPTTVLIYGNPQAGTKLMQIDQRAGIDLPLKILVWTDEANVTHIAYNDPTWIGSRYGITSEDAPVLGAMKALVTGLIEGLNNG